MRVSVYFYIFTIWLYSLDVIINFHFCTAFPKHIYMYKSEVIFLCCLCKYTHNEQPI